MMRRVSIAGVIFDLDGTLVDSALDFKLIRRELRLGPEPILEQMENLPDSRRRECEEVFARHETAGAMRATPYAGVHEWISELDAGDSSSHLYAECSINGDVDP